MNMIDPIVNELEHEAGTTRRLLQRLPQDRLGWQPHVKSMTLGRLATHIAEIPGWVSSILEKDEVDMSGGYTPQTGISPAEIQAMFDKSVAQATDMMKRQTPERLMAVWRLKKDGKVLLEMPRIGVIRAVLMNHLIHHRGQLSVYLRLLDVPIPSIYGPSADQPM
jgi:uncharacterized damage-inducible protein DinB